MNIPEYLEARDITQSDFSRMTGISRSNISNYIAGRRRPSSKHAMTMNHVTNGAIKLKDLMDYADRFLKK